jgi:hypothetical protein
MKTKTAYIVAENNPSLFQGDIEHCINMGYLKQIQIADEGETLYRKVQTHTGTITGSCGITTQYEEVHREVKEPTIKESLTVETSDDYELVLLKEGDKIREGDEIWNREDGQWQSYSNRSGCRVEYDTNPVRRRVLKSELRSDILNALGETDESQIDIVKEIRALRDDARKAFELQKKVEDLERVRERDWVFFFGKINEKIETIESQKRDLAHLQGLFLEHDDKELDRLKSELELKTEVALELDRKYKEAKKGGVKWEKYDNSEISVLSEKHIFIWINYDKDLKRWRRNNLSEQPEMFAILQLPQQPPIDPAEEAWEKLPINEQLELDEYDWKAGYRAAMSQRENK